MKSIAKVQQVKAGNGKGLRNKPALPPERSVAFQIRRAHLAFVRLLTGRLAKHDLKSSYYYYLRSLWLDDGVSQRDLSDSTRVTEPTTVLILKGMEKEGLIDRVRDPHDKRKVLVNLTPLGRSLEGLLLPHAAELNQIATKGLSASDIETTIKVIQKIASNLEEAFEPNDTKRLVEL